MIHRSWMVAAPVAAAVAGVALLSGTGTSAAPPDQHRATQTIELTAQRSVFSLSDTPVPGASFVGGGMLSDASGEVGRGFSHCGVVDVRAALPAPEAHVTAQCTSTFVLRDGELHLSSLRVYDPLGAGFKESKLAVTGGTGAYATARGEGVATRTATTPTVTYTWKLTVTTDG